MQGSLGMHMPYSQVNGVLHDTMSHEKEVPLPYEYPKCILLKTVA